MSRRRRIAGWMFRHAPWSPSPGIARRMFRIAAGMLPPNLYAGEGSSLKLTI